MPADDTYDIERRADENESDHKTRLSSMLLSMTWSNQSPRASHAINLRLLLLRNELMDQLLKNSFYGQPRTPKYLAPSNATARNSRTGGTLQNGGEHDGMCELLKPAAARAYARSRDSSVMRCAAALVPAPIRAASGKLLGTAVSKSIVSPTRNYKLS